MTKPADKWMEKAREIPATRSEALGNFFTAQRIRDGHFDGEFNIEVIARALEATDKAAREEERERCAEFLKDGETVLERLQRGQRSEIMLMKWLAEEKIKSEGWTPMNDEQIKHMVNRFLGWKLPDDFHPDGASHSSVSSTKTRLGQ